jgi:hypothetical protein
LAKYTDMSHNRRGLKEMENKSDENIDSRKIVGLLADEERLRVVSAIVLGAHKVAEIRSAAGLGEPAVIKALNRLSAAGLLEIRGGAGYWLRLELFQVAARSISPKPAGTTSLDTLMHTGRFPRKQEARLALLAQLAAKFEAGRRYPESEVNDILKAVHPDFAFLRRSLIDEGLLKRENETNESGRTVIIYWRTEPEQKDKIV